MNNVLLGFIDLTKDENGKIIFKLNEEEINKIFTVVTNNLIRIIVISIAMFIIIKLGNKLITKFVEKQEKSKLSFSMNPQKAKTIGEVLKSVLKYSVYFIGISLMLSNIFSGISVAVAGVGGFAVGFGAQSLVKDLINGFFILFEDQYGVGDHITIGSYSGIIESIGIRTTIVRDFNGDVHLIPNGSIVEVTNHSRGDMRFMVDVEIAYEEDIDNTIKLLNEMSKVFVEKHKEDLRGEIEVLGINSLNASGVTIRVIGRSRPMQQWLMERELRKDIKRVLDDNRIEIPYPRTKIVN